LLFCVFFVYEIIFTSLEHFEYYFSFSTSVFFLFHKCPLLLLVPYKSDSRAVNRDWAPLGFGTPLGGKLGFFSTSSAPAWLVLPKMDQCHCLSPKKIMNQLWNLHPHRHNFWGHQMAGPMGHHLPLFCGLLWSSLRY